MAESANKNPGSRMAQTLAALWQKNQPRVLERLAAIETAVEAALDGTLTAEQRSLAEATAHKLAGSLGMYGFAKGTELARALEVHLAEDGPDPRILIVLVSELRGTLYPDAPATGNATGRAADRATDR